MHVSIRNCSLFFFIYLFYILINLYMYFCGFKKHICSSVICRNFLIVNLYISNRKKALKYLLPWDQQILLQIYIAWKSFLF